MIPLTHKTPESETAPTPDTSVPSAAGNATSRSPACHLCGRSLVGKSAWAEDVKVIKPGGIRVITRYTCDYCEAAS